MAKMFTRTLSVVNALVGFSKQDPTWPRPLHDLGYALWRLERKVGHCTPDVMFSDRARNRALLIEIKLGHNLREDQHAAYLAITPDDLKHAGYASLDWQGFIFSGMYVTTGDYSERLGIGLDTHGDYPLLVFDEDVALLTRQDLADQELQTLLAGGISLEGLDIPRGYMPFDCESDDLEVLSDLLPRLLSCLRDGKTTSTLEELIKPWYAVWSEIDASVQKDLLKHAARALNRVAKRFDTFFSFNMGQQPYRIEFLVDLSRGNPTELNGQISKWGSVVTAVLAPTVKQHAAGQLILDADSR